MNGMPSKMNVIVTSYRLSAIGWLIGVLSEIHHAIYGHTIRWGLEISPFSCTRDRVPVPMGWNTTWLADPFKCAERFDKVLIPHRPFADVIEACCWYDKGLPPKNLEQDSEGRNYLARLAKPYFKFYKQALKADKLDNVMHISIRELNEKPVSGFKEICEFLEFDMSKFPVIIPIKVKRDWEVWGGYDRRELDSQLIKVMEARKIGKN